MDNQYNYYMPEPDHDKPEQGYSRPDTEYGQTNAEYGQTNPEYGQPNLEPKKKKKMPLAAKVLCLALAFGLVAGTAFEAVGIVSDRLFPSASDAKKSAKATETVESAKLTTSSSGGVTSEITEIAQNAMPSVVSITNMSITEVQSFFGGVRQQESVSAGSGIIISQNDTELLILTNNHVVEGSDTLTVSFIDEESVEANIKGSDATRDLAVLAVQLKDIKDSTMEEIAVATLGDSTKLKVGEPAIAIGNALGYGQSVTSGIVSATKRTLDDFEGELIQTDAAINPGNSGGALLNAKGEVIGINTIKIAVNEVEGIGYAIPISDVTDMVTDLMNRETRTKVPENEQGYLGIEGVDVTSSSSQMYGMPTGVYISGLLKNGGAEKAGLAKGSIITAFDGIEISDMETLKDQLQYYRAGETVKITVQIPDRSGEYNEQTVEVTLGTNS